MKKINFILILIPFFSFAQVQDYCFCVELEDSIKFNYVVQDQAEANLLCCGLHNKLITYSRSYNFNEIVSDKLLLELVFNDSNNVQDIRFIQKIYQDGFDSTKIKFIELFNIHKRYHNEYYDSGGNKKTIEIIPIMISFNENKKILKIEVISALE
jgi:hypothetical protein